MPSTSDIAAIYMDLSIWAEVNHPFYAFDSDFSEQPC